MDSLDSKDWNLILRWFFVLRVTAVAAAALLVPSDVAVEAAEHVIHISVDGLNATIMQSLVDAGEAPNFKRFEDEGAWTINGRTDYTQTVTLPNHTTMLTGRPTLPPEGMLNVAFHNWTENKSVQNRVTLHKDGYIPSVFDVVHDAGMSTALYASKDKFNVFDQSYDDTNGAANPHGRGKIDRYFMQNDGPPRYSQGIVDKLIEEMGAHHYRYVFVHLRDADSVGHAVQWGSSTYRQAIHGVDGYVGEIFRLVETDPQLKGKTAIILTADHGGRPPGHDNPIYRENYTIPVFVWGEGVAHGDLYAMNDKSRKDPGEARVDYATAGQPIRNGDTGNLALSLLGLEAIPTSHINAAQDLRVAIPSNQERSTDEFGTDRRHRGQLGEAN